MPRSESLSAAAPVRIGGYSLDVGTGSGSFARFDATEERTNAQKLSAALAQDEERLPAPVAAVEEFQESADSVTSQIERADKLLTAAADGHVLDAGNVNSEIDALLDLFGRLDRAGRFEEQLKLMRSLNGLLALALRWIDLIRSLRSLLRSARAAGHQGGQAFAHHELGSLNLCAGRSKDASEHLLEALRIEKQIGDVASQCATRHNLDSARRDTLARRAWRRSRRQLLVSILVAAAFILLGGGGGTALGLAIRGESGGSAGGGGDGGPSTGGGHAPATFVVHNDFVPNARTTSATISVTCTSGGRADLEQKAATEAAPAVFYITDFGKGATCTATETPKLGGYKATESGCERVPIAEGKSRSCTIMNRSTNPPKSVARATLEVRKEFSDGTSSPVNITVSCDSGSTVMAEKPRASPGSPAVFKISGFSPGATCAANELTPPAGYTVEGSDCQRVAITDGGHLNCRIVDRLNETTLTVRIDYDDTGTNPVNVSLACPTGVNVTPTSPQPSSPSTPLTFTITGFVPGTTCSATGDVARGYSAPDPSDCKSVPLAAKGECTIVYKGVG